MLKDVESNLIPKSSGIYEMRWAVDNEPRSIPRLNDVDKTGLLYIGKSKNLRRRIRQIQRYVTDQKLRHTAMYTYWYYGFDKKIELNHLQVRWSQVPQNEIDDWEEELIANYVMRYLDKPPLNINLGRI